MTKHRTIAAVALIAQTRLYSLSCFPGASFVRVKRADRLVKIAEAKRCFQQNLRHSCLA